jgi:tetratricopeptide (TPR) repeat protein
MTAYAAGRYDDALREFRTFRRITGSSIHLPHMADCERGLGRPEKALELTASEERNMLDAAGKVELAIVASGAKADLGDYAGAVEELEIPQLDINRAFSFSPRLFEAYADALAAAGRADEAAKWYRQIGVAESALGVGEFAEPDIIDFGEDDESDDAYVGSEDDEAEDDEAEDEAEPRESEPDEATAAVDGTGPAEEEAGLAEDEIGVTERESGQETGSGQEAGIEDAASEDASLDDSGSADA